MPMIRKEIDDLENEEIEIEEQDEDEAYVAETSGQWHEDEYIVLEEDEDEEDL